MKPKTIVTAVLLLFVAVSVVYLIVKESGKETVITDQEMQPAPGINPVKHKVIAYYFHGDFRCATCRSIEAYAKEAVETGFPDALKDGRLEWRVVNIDETSNEHYVKDFQLTTRSVVLEELAEGKSKRWKDLERVWKLVGEKDEFLKYIQDETRAFLETEDQ